jgi:hypothetical protein
MGRVLDVGAAGETHARRAAVLARTLERLRPRLRIAVVYGGNPNAPGAVMCRTYNPWPWKSYELVARDIAGALGGLGFSCVQAFPEDKHLSGRLGVFAPDLVWLNTAGGQGDTPMSPAPALFELLGLPYVGPTPLNAAVLDAKHVCKTQLQGLGLLTAPFETWGEGDRNGVTAILPGYMGRFVVKTVHGRASLHVEIAETRADLLRVGAAVTAKSGALALIEPCLGGAEYLVGISFESNARLAAAYAVAILDGRAKPGELKVGVVEPPDIAINFKKARAAGLKIPYAFFELAWYVYDAEGKAARVMGWDLRAAR